MGRTRPRVDQRVERSRRALHEALVRLILEHGWDRVTVQAVCQRAGVGRSTFYAHFADKEELLIGGLDHVREDLRDAAAPRKPFGFVSGLIAHADRSRRLFRAVIGKRSGLAVQRRFREVVLELMADDLEAHGVGATTRPALARFLSGALVELLIEWVDRPATISALELEHRFVSMATPVLRAR